MKELVFFHPEATVRSHTKSGSRKQLAVLTVLKRPRGPLTAHTRATRPPRPRQTPGRPTEGPARQPQARPGAGAVWPACPEVAPWWPAVPREASAHWEEHYSAWPFARGLIKCHRCTASHIGAPARLRGRRCCDGGGSALAGAVTSCPEEELRMVT